MALALNPSACTSRMPVGAYKEPVYLNGKVMATGCMVSSQFGQADRRVDGRWKVIVELPHVAWQDRYDCLSAVGVLDDFGQIVLVSRDDGSVVLS